MPTDTMDIDHYLNYKGPDQVVTSFELEDILAQSSDKALCVKSKMHTLDRLLEGFESGELIAISGPRKSGKTLFAQSLTVGFLPTKSLWFSYELTLKQFLRTFPELPLFLSPLKLKAYSLPWLKERILEAIFKHSIGVVFIDHLHFLFDMVRAKNTSLEIGQVVRFLKGLAIDYNLIIFLLCHMKKISFDKEPDDSDVRDSSLVSSESDVGLILWRLVDTNNQAMVKVAYSRRTGVLSKTVKIAKINGLLREV
ncbi:MAG: DnaB-like helicase C-terminal domain-containing protein [Desulfatiglandales bacterium]